MGAPSSYPDWDTNATNTTPLVAGHITDGWDTDEVPDSDEMNEWMMLVGLWVRFLGSFTPGTKIGHQILTAGSGTYVPTTGTRRVRIRAVGGGGCGGTANAIASQLAAASGGGSGVFIEKWIDPGALIVGGAYACGAGGVHSGTPAGGDSTISIQSTTYTAKGGSAGNDDSGSATAHLLAGGEGGSITGSTGDITTSENGQDGWTLTYSGGICRAGNGADGEWGSGGGGSSGVSAVGGPATGYGAGGGGGNSQNAAGSATGGNGSPGKWIVEEFA